MIFIVELMLIGVVDIIENGVIMDYWEVLLKNIGEVLLIIIKIKLMVIWVVGIGVFNMIFV